MIGFGFGFGFSRWWRGGGGGAVAVAAVAAVAAAAAVAAVAANLHLSPHLRRHCQSCFPVSTQRAGRRFVEYCDCYSGGEQQCNSNDTPLSFPAPRGVVFCVVAQCRLGFIRRCGLDIYHDASSEQHGMSRRAGGLCAPLEK